MFAALVYYLLAVIVISLLEPRLLRLNESVALTHWLKRFCDL